jgi:hypothetical protein
MALQWTKKNILGHHGRYSDGADVSISMLLQIVVGII